MKIIEVDEELYQYIASHTQSIGESASDILRRLLALPCLSISSVALDLSEKAETETEQTALPQASSPEEDIPSTQSEVEVSVGESENTPEPPVQTAPTEVKQGDSRALVALLDAPEFKQETKAVVRFLTILSGLYQSNPADFSAAIRSENVQGRTRVYFAQDEQTLLGAGNHTKPKQIPNSPHWVITNNNSGRKMIMFEGVMREMGFDEKTIDYVKNAFVAD
ncbi:replication initiation negative regulator SeqA [Lonepinella sp. BR2271]|uniref:replication initiation negative regulator SeqA n=1 Tax=Lonepinella sp. BR2271 TaxID=3434550 RepID=UPI003F6DB04D